MNKNAYMNGEIYIGDFGEFSISVDMKEKTHSPDMGIRYFLFFMSVLLYNMWMLINLICRLSGYSWITLMDFIIAMGRGKWRAAMNDNG